MDRHPEPLSLDDRIFGWLISGCRFTWAHIGTAIILAISFLVLAGLYRHRLRIAAEVGAIRGAYEAARAQEIQKARDFGQGTRPTAPPPEPPKD